MTYSEETAVAEKQGADGVVAPVTGGGDGDVQRVEDSEGVRFLVEGEGRG